MDKKLILDFDKKQKRHKRSKDAAQSSSNKSKQPKLEDHEMPTPSINYRDRAKERREGVNKDFELDPDDLRIANPTYDAALLGDDEEEIDEAELRRRQIEESKYLGGDVEHTHLVKGLDFALLEKVKNDQKLAAKLASDKETDGDMLFGERASDSEEEEFRNEALLAASTSAGSKRAAADLERLKKGHTTAMIPCRTAIARRILNVLDEKWPEKSELFLPGRMSYIVSVDDESDENVTTILRSKADASALEDSKLPDESDFALDQLVNILTKIRKGQTNTEAIRRQKSWDIEDDLI